MNILDKFHHWRRKRRWDKQYKIGRWESLKSERESRRYYQIINYLKEYGPVNPSILDLGCGDGVLNERMKEFQYSHFLGLDFSKVSIDLAKKRIDQEKQTDAKRHDRMLDRARLRDTKSINLKTK